MGIGRRIKEAREKKGLTQDELGKLIGVTGSAITNYEKETSHPKEPMMYALINALDVDANFLFQDCVNKKIAPLLSSEAMKLAHDYDGLDKWGKKQVRSTADIEMGRMAEDRRARDAAIFKASRNQIEATIEIEADERKVIDLLFDEERTAAGSGYQLIEERMQTWKVLYNDLTRKADFCLMVDGRSMEPKICDGDIILIRQQPAVSVGEIGLFTVNDKGYVKKQGSDRLISINDEFEDIIPGECDTVFCRGKVIGILDPDWIVER